MAPPVISLSTGGPSGTASLATTSTNKASDILNRRLPEQMAMAAQDNPAVLTGAPMIETLRQAAQSFVGDDSIADVLGTIIAVRSPLEAATFFITTKYTELGGASGFLGTTTTAITVCPDGQGFFRHFQNGSIYWHPVTGAHEVHGAIRDKWASLGWERSFLGYPATDQMKGEDPQSVGRFNHFQNGSIYWHPEPARVAGTVSGTVAASVSTPSTSALAPVTTSSPAPIAPGTVIRPLPAPAPAPVATAFEIHGAIRAKYLALGAESSFLGYPTTDETGTPDGVGRYNHFQAGSIYWTPSTGAHEVHGLIRDFWALHGWERNSTLGYPITDELIPDRRIGHRRPETRRKPVLTVPADRLKLPAEALQLGFPASVVNVAQASLPAAAPVSAAAPAASIGVAMSFDPNVSVLVNPVLVGSPGSTPAAVSSQNRFSDFESGVLLWRRGETAARQLTAWQTAADGTSMRLTADQVMAAASPAIRAALNGLAGLAMAGVAFAGTTGYSFDGLGVHNRCHRCTVALTGVRTVPGFIPVQMPVTAIVEIRVETAFEATDRNVRGFFVNWSPTVIPPGAADLLGSFAGVLDPLLWTSFDLLQIEDTNAGAPIAVLSVKTMPNGEVDVFIEPVDLPLRLSTPAAALP